jgi:hypothetical protein
VGQPAVPRERLPHEDEHLRRGPRHVEDQAAARRQDTPHLTKCGVFVRHELKAHLTQHGIERPIRQWHCLGARLVPVDCHTRRRCRARHGQHARIDVQPGNRPGADRL